MALRHFLRRQHTRISITEKRDDFALFVGQESPQKHSHRSLAQLKRIQRTDIDLLGIIEPEAIHIALKAFHQKSGT